MLLHAHLRIRGLYTFEKYAKQYIHINDFEDLKFNTVDPFQRPLA